MNAGRPVAGNVATAYGRASVIVPVDATWLETPLGSVI